MTGDMTTGDMPMPINRRSNQDGLPAVLRSALQAGLASEVKV